MSNDVRIYGEAAAGELSIILIGFETDYVTRGNDQVPRDKALIGKIGDAQYRQEYWIDRLSDPKRCDSPMIWRAIKPQYDAWKAGETIVRDGTPLGALPFVNKRQVEAWRSLNIHTAEDLAKIEDGDLPKLGMDPRKPRDMARAYVENKGSATVKLSAELEAERERGRKMEADLADMRQMLAELTKPQPQPPNRRAA